MTPNPQIPDNSPDDDVLRDDSVSAEPVPPVSASFEPDVDEFLAGIWAEELAFLNAYCLDDPISETDDMDSFGGIEHSEENEHSEGERTPSNSQSDGSLPLSTELIEVNEQAFLDGLALSVLALSENVASREAPAAGSRLYDPDRVRVYSPADRVRDLTERVVAVEQAVRVLEATRTRLYAEIPASFSTATAVIPVDAHASGTVVTPVEANASDTANASPNAVNRAEASDTAEPSTQNSNSREELETDPDLAGSALCADPQGVGVLSAANLIALKTRTSDQTVKSHISHAFTLTEEVTRGAFSR